MKKIFNLFIISCVTIFLISTTVIADTNGGSPSAQSAGCVNPIKKKIVRKHPIHKKRPVNSPAGKVCISCIGNQAQ